MASDNERLPTHHEHDESPAMTSEQATSRADSPSGSQERTAQPISCDTLHGRKIVVCCDGTMNSDIKGKSLTNVARFARCVTAVDAKGMSQVVLYQRGIGSGTSWLANGIEGATGRGLVENLQEAYSFICHNYDKLEDQIHLVGFSRGAFTVRSIAQLIHEIGLLTKRGLRHLRSLVKLWKDGNMDRLREEVEKIASTGDSRMGIRIKTCAVWDTVGSLGLPRIWFVHQPAPHRLQWVNSDLCPNIDNAFQALSLNEHRRHFQAIVWRKPKESTQTLRQCWFLGFHSDIGGGNKEEALAHLAMVWVIDQMQHHLTLRLENLWDEVPATNDADAAIEKQQIKRSWSFGINMSIFLGINMRAGYRYQKVLRGLNLRIKESMRGIYVLGGSRRRRPGQHFWNDNGKQTLSTPNVDDGHEEIHFTVRALLADQCYRPCATLRDAKTTIENDTVTWHLKTKKSGISYQLPEAKPSDHEIALLKEWINTEKRRLGVESENNAKPNVLGIFLAMLPEGSNPSKDWSAQAYREETRWKKAKNEIHELRSGIALSWSARHEKAEITEDPITKKVVKHTDTAGIGWNFRMGGGRSYSHG